MNLADVTGKMVVDAYKKTGLTPIQQDWGDGKSCGCALMALACEKDQNHVHELMSKELSSFKVVQEVLRLSSEEMTYFIDGFDYNHPISMDERYPEGSVRPARLAGFHVQEAVREAFPIMNEKYPLKKAGN